MKKILVVLTITIMLLSYVPMTLAATNYAYSFGTDYDIDIDTSDTAIEAASDFGVAGYSSYYNIKPTYQYMRGDNPSTGNPRMESEVLYFYGHSNYDHTGFNYLQKDGDYKTGVYYGYDLDSSSSGYKYAGVKSYDMTDTSLVIFLGCKTGKQVSSNLPSRAVGEGVETSIGWKDTIYESDASSWSRRFTNQLALGESVVDAADYADGFSYYDASSIKDWVIYGNEDLVITGVVASMMASEPINFQEESQYIESEILANNVYVNTTDDTTIILESSDYSNIAKYIKNNINSDFNIDEYKVTYVNKGNGNGVIDINYMVEDYISDSCYTMIIKDNKVKKVFDNEIDDKKEIKIVTKIEDTEIERMKKDSIDNDRLSTDFYVLNQKVIKTYDTRSAKPKCVVLTTYKSDLTDSYYGIDNVFEIE